MRRGDLFRGRRPEGGDPKSSRVFVVVSRQALVESRFSTVVCAPVYTRRDGLGKTAIASWGCGGVGTSKRFSVVPGCLRDDALGLRAQFPDCWSAKSSDSANHKSHMAYAVAGRCPSSHPVAVPTLVVVLLYPPVPRSALLSSGRFAAHADFMNGWDVGAFQKLVAGLNY